MNSHHYTIPAPQGVSPLRSLEAGWEYQPAWRSRQIDEYLVQLGCSQDAPSGLAEIQFSERDPFVRQGMRYRFTGRCVNQTVIGHAFRIADENSRTGLGSRIKSLVLADRFPEEIVETLHLPAPVVSAFEKLFWDVRRYLGVNLWLESLVRGVEDAAAKTPNLMREAVWLRTALDEGWGGLQRLWFRKRDTDAKSLDQLAREIEGIAARRSLRYLQQLEESGAPVSDDDIKRLCIASRRGVSLKPDEGANRNYADFYSRLLNVGTENMLRDQPESPKAKALELVIAERLGLPTPAMAPVRRRMRVPSGS
jgi:hypothetical protein